NTLLLSKILSLNSYPDSYTSGIAAHTNNPACFLSYFAPTTSRSWHTSSRLFLYTSFTWLYHSSPSESAFAAASCNGKNIPLSILLLNRITSPMRVADAIANPTLQPAILWLLLSEL